MAAAYRRPYGRHRRTSSCFGKTSAHHRLTFAWNGARMIGHRGASDVGGGIGAGATTGDGAGRVPSHRRRGRLAVSWRLLALVSMLGAMLALIPWSSAGASTVSTATFSGGAGTVTVGGTLYAKNGGVLTLTVNTSSDTKC